MECRIRVNEQVVTVTRERHTGASIKQAAIEQDVSIKADFVLSIEDEEEPRKTRIVVDDEEIHVEDDICFVAVADDDNS